MSLFIASLNSGSNGNCYYVGNSKDAVLVDVGISCREVEKRMQRLGLSMLKVKAIFISHEHSDHIRGLTVLAKKYSLPVYITPRTQMWGRLELEDARIFPDDKLFTIGSLTVAAFLKHHDAAEPHSFTVSCDGVTVGVFTDIGVPCTNLLEHFSQCHAAILEANYDEHMLHGGKYPFHLKRRISGGKGHLSNRQALELFKAYRAPYLSHLLLAHLSKENNCPDLVQKLFDAHAGDTKVVVASRYQESAVYHIQRSGYHHVTLTAPPVQLLPQQYSLF
ncbi:MBL fold metallo-hydrolase [Mucilaginibacter koreensis]